MPIENYSIKLKLDQCVGKNANKCIEFFSSDIVKSLTDFRFAFIIQDILCS